MEKYPPQNKLIGRYLGAGACGFAFEVVGEPDKVLKVGRLIDYKTLNPLTISDFKNDGLKDYGADWKEGVALNEFQAVLFSQLYDMQDMGEEITSKLPYVYGFSSGEMQKNMLDEVTRSNEFYDWNSYRYEQIMNSFHPRKGNTPGTRVGLWVVEKLERADKDEKTYEDTLEAEKQVVELNKWLRTHNYVVRDTKNEGNWGFRKSNNEIVWFDPGVSPWPIKEAWRDSEDVKLRNLYYLFRGGFGRIAPYDRKLENIEKYDETWHQAEDNE